MRKVLLLVITLMMMFQSCSRKWGEMDGEGTLSVYFSESSYAQTKASADIPDTGAFLLKITDSAGKVIYDGRYGDSPEKLIVKAGTYNISVRSTKFSKPAFSAPVFGDDQCVVVNAGSAKNIYMVCEQMNSGMKLKVASNFLTSYPDGVLYLKSSEGKLMYGYSEKRIAYFNPGKVSLVLNDSGKEKTLCTKALTPKQILVLSVSAPAGSSSSSGRIFLDVDTARVWTGDKYVIGGDNSGGSGSTGGNGSSKDRAYSVSQAKSELGAEDVWVYGYVVGGDLTSASISFEEPFKSNANVAIAGRASVSEKESCLSVQLLKGDIRDALNLVDNPELLGRKVYMKGDIVESYYGIPGIKNITDFVIQ